MQTKFEKLENEEIKMIVSIPKDEFEKYHEKAFKKVRDLVEIDGFRKGNAPEDLIVKKYGDMIILEEMSHLAINDTYYASIIKENETKKEDQKIIPITEPKINIIKLGVGSDFEYNAVFATLPKVELPDYKKISKTEREKALEGESEIITEEEVLNVLKDLQKARNTSAHVHEDGTVHSHSHDDEKMSEGEDKKDLEEKVEETSLPELDDTFAQSFGEHFKTLDDLKNKIKENLESERKAKITDKKRTYVLEALIKETKINVSEALIEDELERMKSQMKADVERFGSKWDEYLEHLKKTEEELKTEWRDVANKRVVSQLVLNEIAKKEKVEVSREEIDTEAVKILAQMPEANEDHVNSYVHQILINEKVMKILDGEEK